MLPTGATFSVAANTKLLLSIPAAELVHKPQVKYLIVVLQLSFTVFFSGYLSGFSVHAAKGPPANYEKYRLSGQSCAPPPTRSMKLLVSVIDSTMVSAFLLAAAVLYSLNGLPGLLCFLLIRFMCLLPLVQHPFLHFPLSTTQKYLLGVGNTVQIMVYVVHEERCQHILTYWGCQQFILSMIIAVAGSVLSWQNWNLYDPTLSTIILCCWGASCAIYLISYNYYQCVRGKEIDECRGKRDEFLIRILLSFQAIV